MFFKQVPAPAGVSGYMPGISGFRKQGVLEDGTEWDDFKSWSKFPAHQATFQLRVFALCPGS